MFRNSAYRQRVWVLVLTLVILGVMSWADTFDLSDDLPPPLGTGEQVLLAEEVKEQVFLGLVLSAQVSWFFAPVVLNVQALHTLGYLPPPQSDLQLYQRFSTYRI
jgi:hypothetical protein